MKNVSVLFLALFACITSVIITGCGVAHSGKQMPKAIGGVLDLRNWDFEKDGPVRLDGEWDFFRESHLDTFATHEAQNVQVPGGWVALSVPGTGYGTYQLQVLIDPVAYDVGILVNEFSTAYELDINGTLTCSSGTIGTSEDATTPEYDPVLCFIDGNQKQMNLLARVSNYHHFNGGLLQPILIGKYEELAQQNTGLSRFAGFLYGLLVIIGLFHLAIYLFRRKEVYNLYYSFYCLFSALAFACTTERLLFTVLGPDLWTISYKISLTAPAVLLTSFVLFYDQFFKGIMRSWIRTCLLVPGALLVLFVMFSPTSIGSYAEIFMGLYIMLLILVGLIMNIISMRRKLPSSVLLFLCNLFFICAFVYDGAFIDKQLGGLTLSHVATAIYVIVISSVLSRRFASTFGKVDTLSGDLIEANKRLEEQNKNLEKEVEQRTQQVVLAEKMSVLGQLTANIAHEINTPLGAIKASAYNVHESFSKSNELMKETGLEPGSWQIVFSIVKDALNEESELSPKEERLQKKKMIVELEQAGVGNASMIADYFVRVGLFEIKQEYYTLLRKVDSEKLIALLMEQLEQVINNRNIRVAVEKVSKIMFALKSYSRFNQSGEMSESNIEADIDTVLTLYHAWLKQGIEVITDYGGIPELNCLVDELNQVWTNLIMNAVQAMGNSGTITIATRKEKDQAIIRIADTGPGIPEAIQKRIFEPFFTTKPHGEGSGLGLDIVKSILKKHNGSISVESVPGNTVFTVILPYNNK